MSEHHHQHHISADADRRYLWLALLLLGSFMLVEVVVGILASSLALITDAGHMLTDVGAIGLALFAMHIASRPGSGHFTFGYKRVEILSAQANGITLLLLAAWFVWEGIARLLEPPEVSGLPVLATALVGIAVNLPAVWLLGKAERRSLNVEGSFQHVLTDLYAFIATAIAGAIVWATGWNQVDTLAALVVAALMLRSGYYLVRESARVFLEAAPRHLDPDAICRAMCEQPGIAGVGDLHIWEVTSGLPALSAHLYVVSGDDLAARRRQVAALLAKDYGIEHATLQTEHAANDGSQAVGLACTSDVHA